MALRPHVQLLRNSFTLLLILITQLRELLPSITLLVVVWNVFEIVGRNLGSTDRVVRVFFMVSVINWLIMAEVVHALVPLVRIAEEDRQWLSVREFVLDNWDARVLSKKFHVVFRPFFVEFGVFWLFVVLELPIVLLSLSSFLIVILGVRHKSLRIISTRRISPGVVSLCDYFHVSVIKSGLNFNFNWVLHHLCRWSRRNIRWFLNK